MRPERFVITDRQWRLIEPLPPGTARSRGVTARDNRLFLEAVLWKVRVGGPWRDLPPGFGAWNSVFRRFHRKLPGDMEHRRNHHHTAPNVHGPWRETAKGSLSSLLEPDV